VLGRICTEDKDMHDDDEHTARRQADADAAEIADLRKELAAEREHMAELEALARHEADCAEAYKAEAAMLRATMTEATYALSKARIWGGMDWHYNPLHPMHYKPALDKMREVLDGPNV